MEIMVEGGGGLQSGSVRSQQTFGVGMSLYVWSVEWGQCTGGSSILCM